jgi:hypothetical protein
VSVAQELMQEWSIVAHMRSFAGIDSAVLQVLAH